MGLLQPTLSRSIRKLSDKVAKFFSIGPLVGVSDIVSDGNYVSIDFVVVVRIDDLVVKTDKVDAFEVTVRNKLGSHTITVANKRRLYRGKKQRH